MQDFDDTDIHSNGGDGIDYSYYFHIKERFSLDKDAKTWTQGVALQCGLEITISSIKQSGTVKYLKCNHGQPNKSKGRNLIHTTRWRISSKVGKCPFQIKTKQPISGEWIIIIMNMNDYHNHTLYKSPGGLIQHCKLSKEEK